MSGLRVIGVDPGPTPGIVVLDIDRGRVAFSGAFQCSAEMAAQLVMSQAWGVTMPVLVQVETFVVGHRSSRSSTPQAGRVTRELADFLVSDLNSRENWLGRVVSRSAANVKPWATDARLEAAGLLKVAKPVGRHAVDAARHALFCAVHDGSLPDPLSKQWKA